jgi:pimeloyl-ACP methyl ester carboxylesterase
MRRPLVRHIVIALTAAPLVFTLMSAAPASSDARAGSGAAAAAGLAAATGQDRTQKHGIAWRSCAGDQPAFECARVRVPLDYDRPRGRVTKLALARYPAQGPGKPRGTVFVNPGGPGVSGVEMVLGGFGQLLGAALGGRFHVVGFDPRGVGSSDPIHCFESEDEIGEFLEGLPAFPYRADQRRPFFERMTSLWPTCRSQREAVLRHMSTADVVRDLDRLRRLVGDRKLTYLGFSYGSYLGNTYAHLFPRRVRAMVIDGVLHPRRWANGSHAGIDARASRDEWAEFLRLCGEARDECAFWRPEGPRQRWNRLAAQIRQEPVDLDGFPYTYDLLIADAVGAMFAPEVWGGPEGYAAFLDLVADAALGDERAAAEAVRMRSILQDQLTADEADYPNGFEAYFGNQCADTQYPRSLSAFTRFAREVGAISRFGPLWWWGNANCANWPTAPDRYAGPWGTRTAEPVLVVGNYFDAVTGYQGAVASARLLAGSRLLTYAGWGHTAYGRNACVAEHVNEYLVRGSLPPRGTVCAANPNPFMESVALRTAPASGPSIGLPPPWLFQR